MFRRSVSIIKCALLCDVKTGNLDGSTFRNALSYARLSRKFRHLFFSKW